tara:strand:- start:33 stop:281 length:249 start_codon:yes stop_codon:yes gene_type:complete
VNVGRDLGLSHFIKQLNDYNMEQLLIKKINQTLRQLKKFIKKPSDTNIGYLLNRLKDINPMLYEDYLEEYKIIYKHHKLFGS